MCGSLRGVARFPVTYVSKAHSGGINIGAAFSTPKPYLLHTYTRNINLTFASPPSAFTMALNSPSYKVYDSPELAIDDINKFTKG